MSAPGAAELGREAATAALARRPEPIERVAYVSLHTSPLAQPGISDAGGMNVYIHELAATMARRGVEVEVFTRRTDPDVAAVVDVVPGYRVVHVDAGPAAPLPIAELPGLVADFAEGIIKHAYVSGARYDLVHSHYWLSGWAGVLVKEAFDIPLANSFHTLARIKDRTRPDGSAGSPLLRIAAEEDVIARSDCVVASTPGEAEDLIEHYRASPERLCVSPPGIDHHLFSPGPRAAARHELGLARGPLALFVGRIQPLKGLDVAVRALAMTVPALPAVRLAIVGGPSGPGGQAEVDAVRRLATELGVGERLIWCDPQPHDRLVQYYRAADVLLVPSRSESFGLVAAEAQACGLPVVATHVGGLAYLITDGESGFLVPGPDAAEFATAMGRILADDGLAARLAAGAVANAARFSWDATADRLLELYAGITADETG